ncbi:hypothetical protein BH18ACI4_BH18ACI4_19640 [soil metagenome]
MTFETQCCFLRLILIICVLCRPENSDPVVPPLKSSTRADIAYIAARIISASSSTSIYDYSRNKYVQFSGPVSTKHVNVFDYDESCYVTGNGNGSKLSLFHYGNSNFIDLKIHGTNFEGYDFGTASFFNGSVRGRSVSLFDYESSQYYSYII